jgi:dCMP deaminase
MSTVGSEGWDQRFIQFSQAIAECSKDPSTKVGCVIVGPDREILSTGFNGFPRGVEDTEERLNNREEKYRIIVHAEANAVIQAARVGTRLKGSTAYCSLAPCSKCAGFMIQAGISRVVVPTLEVPDRWKPDCELSLTLFKEAGVEIQALDSPVY